MSDFKKLGRKIAEIRKLRGITSQVQLATELDLSTPSIANLEMRNKIHLDSFVKIANHLNVSAEYLLNDKYDSLEDFEKMRGNEENGILKKMLEAKIKATEHELKYLKLLRGE